MTQLNSKKIMGIPLPLYICLTLITAFGVFTETFAGGFGDVLLIWFVLGSLFSLIGDHLPIWKDYIGGGAMATLFGCSILVHFGVMPEKYLAATKQIFSVDDLMTPLVVIIMITAILGIDKKALIKSFGGIFPAIVGALLGAAVFTILGGMLFGINIGEVMTSYVYPVMSGGASAGALPMSQIYAELRPDADGKAYYSTIMSIMTIANILAVFFAILMVSFGKKIPGMVGDGENLVMGQTVPASAPAESQGTSEKPQIKTTIAEIGAAIMFMLGILALATLFGRKILPSIFGFGIHTYVYVILFTLIANFTGIIPPECLAGADLVKKFILGYMGPMFFACIGLILFDFNSFLAALSFKTVAICAIMLLGACLGSGIVGRFFGLYPVDTAIISGLCMANMGATGDMMVLGGCNRLGLIGYATVVTRIGGGLLLLIASATFGMFL